MRCIIPSHSQLHNHQNIWTVQWIYKIGEVEGLHPWWQPQFPFVDLQASYSQPWSSVLNLFLSVCRTGLCRIWKFLLDGLIKNCRTCLLKTPRWGTSLYYEVYHPITPTSTQPSKHMDCPMNFQDWRSGRHASMVATSIPLCWITGLAQPAMEQWSQSVF